MTQSIKNYKSKILYHGGSYPVPSYHQKGKMILKNRNISIAAKGKKANHEIKIEIPARNIIKVVTEEKKYYSSTAYMLNIHFVDRNEKEESVELEIRSFGRRGRAQAIARWWAETLTTIKEEEK